MALSYAASQTQADGMTEKTSETARENGQYQCLNCGAVIMMEKGALVPLCPRCGFDTFGLRNPRFISVEQAAEERARTRET
jgi:Zn finger protein HypA/HybF involved in hydrogenase expression